MVGAGIQAVYLEYSGVGEPVEISLHVEVSFSLTVPAPAGAGTKDYSLTAPAATPATIFPILGNLAQKHLKKLKGSNKGRCVNYEKQIGKITSLLGPSFPARMSLPQQGAFQLGYYHQTQDRYQKKEEKQDV